MNTIIQTILKGLLLFLALFLFSCNQNRANLENRLVISGKIENPIDSIHQLTLFPQNTKGRIEMDVEKDGSFKDTLVVSEGKFHTLVYGFGRPIMELYLKNGMDLHIDYNNLHEKPVIKISGKGAAPNQLILERKKLFKKFTSQENIYQLSKEEFEKNVDRYLEDFLGKVEREHQDLDSNFTKGLKKDIGNLKNSLLYSYESAKKNQTLTKGSPSPTFEKYTNYNGGTNSLSDYLGKYVYIDLWATWCAPCIKEMPALKELQKEYKDKNINILSISIDVPKDEDKWKNMIESKSLQGIQLMADNAGQSQFILDYNVAGIPRYILLNPEGKIVEANAPRPSDPKLKELFNEVGIN